MLPISIRIAHFRALRDCEISLSDNTVLVGANGVGKSTVLQALRFFMDPGQTIVESDLQPGSTDEISVAVTFSELNAEEKEHCASYLDLEGNLTVTKKGSPGDVRYVVSGRKHPPFDHIRALKNQVAAAYVAQFKNFASEHPSYGLTTTATSRVACERALCAWEAANPDQCVDADVNFVLPGSSKHELIATTRVVYVAAVHEAAQDVGGSRSPLAQMMNALVYPQLESNEDLTRLRDEAQARYEALFPPGGTKELAELSKRITTTLEQFAPGTSISLGWGQPGFTIGPPAFTSSLIEDGVACDVDRQGHGLQRALIIAILQAEEEQQRSATPRGSDEGPVHVLLLIEEPELYQHPPRARHFNRVLQTLSSKAGGPSRLRVISTTHSPAFVSMENIESIRIIRRRSLGHGVPVRRVTSVQVDAVSKRLAEADPALGMASADVRLRLHTVDEVLREAFFASAVVLVEGVGDVGVIAAGCAAAGVDLEARGIVVVQLNGKPNLAPSLAMLDILSIKHYAIFDSDGPNALRENQRLLRLLKVQEDQIPTTGAPPTIVTDTYAIFDPKVEGVLPGEFGAADFKACMDATVTRFGIKADSVLKNPVTARYALDLLHQRGKRSPTLDAIVEKIGGLA